MEITDLKEKELKHDLMAFKQYLFTVNFHENEEHDELSVLVILSDKILKIFSRAIGLGLTKEDLPARAKMLKNFLENEMTKVSQAAFETTSNGDNAGLEIWYLNSIFSRIEKGWSAYKSLKEAKNVIVPDYIKILENKYKKIVAGIKEVKKVERSRGEIQKKSIDLIKNVFEEIKTELGFSKMSKSRKFFFENKIDQFLYNTNTHFWYDVKEPFGEFYTGETACALLQGINDFIDFLEDLYKCS
jgi:hypothetical protein